MTQLTDEEIIDLFEEEFGAQDLDVADAEVIAFARALIAKAAPQLRPIIGTEKGKYILFYPAVLNDRGGMKLSDWYNIENLPASGFRQPTHYMPLPAAPDSQKKE